MVVKAPDFLRRPWRVAPLLITLESQRAGDSLWFSLLYQKCLASDVYARTLYGSVAPHLAFLGLRKGLKLFLAHAGHVTLDRFHRTIADT